MVETKRVNIDVAKTIDCNLLCKLIIDYLPSNTCSIKSNIIEYEKGSFINYRDTNFEVSNIHFFSPSRHTIDGETFDMEVNIYHGGDNATVSHFQYHSEDTNI